MGKPVGKTISWVAPNAVNDLNTRRSKFGKTRVCQVDGVLKNQVSTFTKKLLAGKRAAIHTFVALPMSALSGCNFKLRVKEPSASVDSMTDMGTSNVNDALKVPHSISTVFLSVTATPLGVRTILLPSTLTYGLGILNGAIGAEQIGNSAPIGSALIVIPSVLLFFNELALKLMPLNVTDTTAGTIVKLAVVRPHRIMTVWFVAIPAALGFSAMLAPLIVTCELVAPKASVAMQFGNKAPEGNGVIPMVFDVPFVRDAPLRAIWESVATGTPDEP